MVLFMNTQMKTHDYFIAFPPQIWVNSSHNASGYYTIYGDESLHSDHFEARLACGDIHTTYARTGFLGFIRRTEMTQSDGGKQAIFGKASVNTISMIIESWIDF